MATLASGGVLQTAAHAAVHRTKNFVVNAPTPQLAREIADSAEAWRERLAIEWIGEPMPDWTEPCKTVVRVSPNLGAGGATTFVFDRGEVFGWEMTIQGSKERILDSVLPHEITHTVFACYFRRPLPRWADEGACTTVEHKSEVGKQERLLIRFLKNGQGIDFREMFGMKEYPADVLPLYAQGHSLTQFLIERRGKPAFLAFLADGMVDEDWRRAVAKHYGHENEYALQEIWLEWVKAGRPRLELEPDVAVAAATPTTPQSGFPVRQVSAQTDERLAANRSKSVYMSYDQVEPPEAADAPREPVRGWAHGNDAAVNGGATYWR
ncbi:hypothetical protein [Pseudobythopirellula maris]|uniref:hypothetical protein n=1 Tax=Pseudobythopirellula maris TaxID=2527991 RepID=UPI0011B6BD54|nr:hypothetical protein [Pseudobythopirellula maris]